jgi:hypothetical protein
MPDNTITFEQIDALMKRINVADYQAGGKLHLTAGAVQLNAAAALAQICPIYKAIRPILQVVTTLPFIPAQWRGVIQAFIGVMDAICPQS